MIRNLLFDLGGILVDLNVHETLRKMRQLMPIELTQISERDLLGAGGGELVDRYQVGAVSTEEFFQSILKGCRKDATVAELRDAWLSMLDGIPQQRLEAILRAKQRGINCYILSNINESHVEWTIEHLEAGFSALGSSMDDVFTKVYFSNEIHLAKPSQACYDYVLQDSGLNPQETLYIDDLEQNIQAGKQAGFVCLQSFGDAWIAEVDKL